MVKKLFLLVLLMVNVACCQDSDEYLGKEFSEFLCTLSVDTTENMLKKINAWLEEHNIAKISFEEPYIKGETQSLRKKWRNILNELQVRKVSCNE